MSWTAAGNIESRRDSIATEFPGIVIYLVGDTSHAARASDHNPDARDLVHALDAMTYGDTGRGYAIVEWMLADPQDLEYVIFDGVIYSRSNEFEPADYDGSDPHTDHVHASGKHGGTGWCEQTGAGYDTTAEAYRPAGFNGGNDMLHFVIDSNDTAYDGQHYVGNGVMRRGPLRTSGRVLGPATTGAPVVTLTDASRTAKDGSLEPWPTFLDDVAGRSVDSYLPAAAGEPIVAEVDVQAIAKAVADEQAARLAE